MGEKHTEQKRDSSSVQSVDRALKLLRLVAGQNMPVSLGVLCELSQLNRTTVWRLMTALEHNGFVERNDSTKEYQLGYETSVLCTGIIRQYEPIIRLARPFLEELWRESLETIVLSVARCGGMLSIEQLDSPQSIRVRNYLGEVDPLHCTSNGKVMMAYLPDEELEALFRTPLKKRTEKTVIDPEILRRQIAAVRQKGYCMIFGEYEENENGISIPVLLQERPACIVNMCGPSFRMTEEYMLCLLPKMKDICRRLEQVLNYKSPR